MNAGAQTHPRVMVLAQNKIQPFTGGGVVLSALFRGFPRENLLFFHRDQQYAFASQHEEHWLAWWWLRIDLPVLACHLRLWLGTLMRHPASARAKDAIALILASAHFRMPDFIDERIRAFRPDIIYAWAADSLWARTLEKTVRRYRLPYVIHFMDNHFEVDPQTALQRALAPVFRKQLTRVASQAAALYTISESMGRAYQSYWSRPYEVYRGTIDISCWPWPNSRTAAEHGVFLLGFAGSVDHSQLLGLSAIARAAQTLSSQGRSVRLVLYLTDHYARAARAALAGNDCVEIRQHPDAGGLRAEFASLDALVLAYSFDETTLQYYRYSFATKIAPYMLSGRPILAYGPAAIEPIAYCSRGQWALVVDDSSEPALADAIGKLMTDTAFRERLAKSAWQAAQSEHDQDTHAARFASSLSRLADSNGSRAHGRLED